jgi:hypothetical protein
MLLLLLLLRFSLAFSKVIHHQTKARQEGQAKPTHSPMDSPAN